MPEPIVTTYAQPTPHLLSLLASHLPSSLPLLRRLQFTRFPGGVTEHTRILYVGPPALLGNDSDAGRANGNSGAPSPTPSPFFAAAYVDLSCSPETEVWLYSSLESLPAVPTAEQTHEAGDQVLSLLGTIRGLRDEYDAGPWEKRKQAAVMFGTLNETVRRALLNRGLAFPYSSQWDKWVFQLNDGGMPGEAVVGVSEAMGKEGMAWGSVLREDTGLVISRTKIPRTERTLVSLPSTAIKLRDGTPIAWAFLSPDGSLASLHCEEPYRGRGFAKALAVKLMQDHLSDFGGDGYGAADVAANNPQSQRVCRSLGGKVMWTISWSRIDLDRLP